MYKKRMMLQLFEDGAGAGSGTQGEMPGMEMVETDPLVAHPEHMKPEHIPMNNWKRLQVRERKSRKEQLLQISSEVRE